MDAAKSKKQPTKIADITKPGKSAPSSTTRPVIVTHRPVLKDPMMVQDATTPDSNAGIEDAKPVSHLSHSIKLQPLHDDVKPEETPGAPSIDTSGGKTIAVLAEEAAKRKAEKDKEEQVTTEADESPAAESSKVSEEPTGPPAVETTKLDIKKSKPAEKAEEAEDEEKADAKVEDKPSEAPAEPDEAETEDKPVEPAEEKTEEKPADAPAEPELKLDEDDTNPADRDEPGDTNLSESAQREELAAQKQAEEQEKIITSGKYYLPINAVAHRRTKRHITVGLLVILLLAAALFLAAWDANFFSIPGYTAPTDYL